MLRLITFSFSLTTYGHTHTDTHTHTNFPTECDFIATVTAAHRHHFDCVIAQNIEKREKRASAVGGYYCMLF